MSARSGTHDGIHWRLAPCLVAMEDEANRLAPNRAKQSDGSIASAAHHQQNPDSDHEIDQDPDGNWVDALDTTDSPGTGWDAHARVLEIVARRDHRVSYLISRRTVWRSYDKPHLPAWTPEPYTGVDPHTSHSHTSILDAHRQDTTPWWPTPTVQEDDDMEIFHITDGPNAGQLWLRQGDRYSHIPNEGTYHEMCRLLPGRSLEKATLIDNALVWEFMRGPVS